MVLLIILVYFIIGFVVGLYVYDYHCKDFKKSYEHKGLKVTWEEYSRRENPGFVTVFVMILWPVFVIIITWYYVFQYPLEHIKERNGIK